MVRWTILLASRCTKEAEIRQTLILIESEHLTSDVMYAKIYKWSQTIAFWCHLCKSLKRTHRRFLISVANATKQSRACTAAAAWSVQMFSGNWSSCWSLIYPQMFNSTFGWDATSSTNSQVPRGNLWPKECVVFGASSKETQARQSSQEQLKKRDNLKRF